MFSAGGISTSLSVLCHLLKQMGAKDLILHHWNQVSAAAEWMHRHIKLMVQKNIHALTSQWSLGSGPSCLQQPPLLVSTARVEGKWLFTACSSTHHATADTHTLQSTASCIFMQCMTEGRWSSEGFQDLNSLPFKKISVYKQILKTGSLLLDRTQFTAAFCTQKCNSPALSGPAAEFWGLLELTRWYDHYTNRL